MGSIQGSVNQALGGVAQLMGTARFGQMTSKKMSLEAAKKKAMESSQASVEAKTEQKNEFMEYVKKQPTSFGGTVGDLDERLQKKIAESYTPEQREKILEEIKKEKKNG